ncbi:MAG: endonuclease MutS2, partial [Chloroflexi bacterium]|nr:endonuclease MutS2 [Chloroflexota bacterium]
AISRSISERGEVLDHASEQLAGIRGELKVSHERLMSRLERMVNDPKNAPILQEALITQRNGRYVIPLRAEFKGRLRSIIHDQSASGATLFVEPLAVVELNNRYHELQLAERDEVRRILAALSAQVGANAGQIQENVEALGQLDLALMCAKYAEDLHAADPELLDFQPARPEHPGSTIRLYQARHPLLDPGRVVPIDVDLDPRTFALVITGPNTGGKTVTLKTVGLQALMAQSGLHIPAQSGSALSLFTDIYADIGDEQSIEQSLSTFSGHITNIVRILNRAHPHSLVLLDELGAGTDPQEGAALARALLQYLVDQRIPSLVATHYPELKAFAHTTPGVVNASMEFDMHSLRPTYHLTIGLPGRSNALLIAERLGMPAEILEHARQTINPEDLRAEDLLDEIHQQRDLARRARGEAEQARLEAERLRNELATRLERIEDERLGVIEQGRAEAEQEVSELRAEMEELRRALNRARQPLEAIRALEKEAETLQEMAQRPIVRRAPLEETTRPLRVGDKVRIRSLKMDGVINGLGENEVEVQLGSLRVRARLNDLQRPGEPEAPVAPLPPAGKRRKPAAGTAPVETPGVLHVSPGAELDLRGQRTEEALEALEDYVESAYLAGLPYVRIIHGKGTGALRTAVRNALKHAAQVRKWESGLENEGGEGVTVAHLKED